MNERNHRRPKTPKWMRRTVFGRHREEFLIGGGILLIILTILSITISCIFFTRWKAEKEMNIANSMARAKESPARQLPTEAPRGEEDPLFV